MNSETFGEFIKRKRIKAGLTLREVASAVSIDQSILSKIERNKFSAPQKIIPSLADRLGVDYKKLQVKYLSDKVYNEIKSTDFSLEALEIVLKRLEKEKSGTSFEKEKEQLIEDIKKYFVGIPVEKVWIFGSFARDEESRDSDLDLLVRFMRPNDIDLFEYIGIQQELEDITGRRIDLVEEGQEMEKIKPIIDGEKKLIYEKEAV